MWYIVLIFVAFFVARLATLRISIRNEKRLIAEGAVQYGKRNSLLLTLAHLLFYFGALAEAYVTEVQFDWLSVWGLVVMAFAYLMLFYVIYCLRHVWTVKLYIAREHVLVTSWLFRTVRHPNYFLNILPELVGVTLLCHAWYTFAVMMPIYLVLLMVRITQEERAMRDLWAAQG